MTFFCTRIFRLFWQSSRSVCKAYNQEIVSSDCSRTRICCWSFVLHRSLSSRYRRTLSFAYLVQSRGTRWWKACWMAFFYCFYPLLVRKEIPALNLDKLRICNTNRFFRPKVITLGQENGILECIYRVLLFSCYCMYVWLRSMVQCWMFYQCQWHCL